MDKQEKIDLYIQNKLSEKETKEFETEMRQDDDLRAEVLLAKQIQTAFEHKEEKAAMTEMRELSEEEMKAIIYGKESKEDKKRKNFKQLIIGTAAAAAVIIVCLFIGFQPKHDYTELFDTYYASLPYEKIPSRGGSRLPDDKKETLTEAISLYEQQDYLEALEKFKEVLEINKEMSSNTDSFDLPEEITFYTGMSLLETNNTKEAIHCLRPLAYNSQSVYKEDSQWYLALAYLKEKNRKESEKLLKLIAKENGFYSNPAKKLLKEIES